MNTLAKLLAGSAAALLPALAGASSIALPIATDVNVVNTPKVTVANTAGAPVPVQVVGNVTTAGVTPVGGTCSALYGTVTNVKRCDLYTVPAGKRLVVETVVYQSAIEGNPGYFPYYVNVVGQNTQAFLSLAPTFTGNDGYNHYAGTAQTRFYLDAGDTLSIYTQFSQPTILGQRYSFSGYLENP